MKVEESYGWLALAANAAQGIIGAGGGTIGGFLCQTAGTMKLTVTNGAGATIVDTLAVVAGTFYPVPLVAPPGTVVYCTLAGGAAGTMFLNQN